MYDLLANIFVAAVAIAYFVLFVALAAYFLRTRARFEKANRRHAPAFDPRAGRKSEHT